MPKGGLIRELQGTQDYSPSVRNFLREHGSEMVTQVQVMRKPVASAITTALDFITLGTFSKYSKEEGYDKFFHLGLYVMLSGGGVYRVEKLSQITITPWSKNDEMYLGVKGLRPVTFQAFMDKGRALAGDQGWFTYNAFDNNCQHFVMMCLKANGMWRPNVEAFVLQPVDELIKKLPSYTEKIARTATDLGSIAERVMFGAGKGAVIATINSLK